MPKEKTISQKLRELADWLDLYKTWYEAWKEHQKEASTQDEGGQPGGPPPPPPPGGGFGGN